ncbi:MAG: nickel/cobalt transporter (NicO) family protein [Chloroflexota bacterium]|jgi:ABC-type nickel/cobalt efflux system permease component RcnA|nr:nickel/cobalt transporter (NicO) family protein [Chloroflexota bacterium]
MKRRHFASLALSLAALALVVPAASAHPLGNFTINHYNGIRVGTEAVVIDHVTDFAEIPTFAERRAMDANADGSISAVEAADYQLSACNGLTTTLLLTANGSVLALTPIATGLHFAAGSGSDVMRLVCVLRAQLALPASGTTFEFSDPSFAERRGWREIVVEGDAATITETEAAAAGVSARLTSYPSELLSLPLDQASATFTARPGGAALPPASYPDATPVGAPSVPQPVAEPVDTDPVPAVPGGTTDLGADVTALFQAPDLTPPIILLSLLVATALGALHALSPGHGKTVMAAYLVGSRGNARQAIGLGLTVTVSHTLGVLALGLLSLSAAAILPPERLYPILSIASGAIVVVVGAYLLMTRLRSWRRESRAHRHQDDHQHGSDHPHRPEGWHEHDGMGHTHLPQQGMGRRGLFALGLSGGMIPSVSALLVLIGSISIGRPAWGIVLTVAFGLGMAAVLVGVGIALVHARKLVERLPVARTLRFGQRLPVLTAAVVLIAGLLIAGQGLAGLG